MTPSVFSILNALGHPTRWRVFEVLLKSGSEGMIASEIADTLGVYRNLMSTHLRVMKEAGLISREQRGREVRYTVTPTTAREVAQGMLDAIDGALLGGAAGQ